MDQSTFGVDIQRRYEFYCNNNEYTNTVARLDTSTTLSVDCYAKYMYMVLHMYTLRSDYELHTVLNVHQSRCKQESHGTTRTGTRKPNDYAFVHISFRCRHFQSHFHHPPSRR